MLAAVYSRVVACSIHTDVVPRFEYVSKNAKIKNPVLALPILFLHISMENYITALYAPSTVPCM